MSPPETTNGPVKRKQLSDQLDRLDGIIDCLAEGLNSAVADAAREGTRAAVKDAILEIVANPELRALVGRADPAPAPPRPSAWARLRAKVADATAAVLGTVRPAAAAAADRCRAAKAAMMSSARAVATAWQVKKIVLVGLGI